MKNLKLTQNGFTLIELMITVAIVGVLSAIALPAYQDYTIRAQVSEGIYLTNGAKVFVVNYFTERGAFPENNQEAGFPGATGKYVSTVAIKEDGVIEATFGNNANTNLVNETVKLVPSETTAGNLIWDCDSSMVNTDKVVFLPQACR